MSAIQSVNAELQLPGGVAPLGFGASNTALLNRTWETSGAIDAAVAWAIQYNLSALIIDNETPPSPKGGWGKPTHVLHGDLPAAFARFLRALQSALAKVGKRAIADVSSTWGGDIVGPDYLKQYAATGASVMDMQYFGPGDPNANQFGKPEPRMFSYVFEQAAAQHPGLQPGDAPIRLSICVY